MDCVIFFIKSRGWVELNKAKKVMLYILFCRAKICIKQRINLINILTIGNRAVRNLRSN